MSNTCQHLEQATLKTSDLNVCEECVKMGDRWVHLRICLECGNVGCCDQSKNQHSRKHWEATQHPVIRSHQPGEKWVYCWEDDIAWMNGLPDEDTPGAVDKLKGLFKR